MGNYPKAPVPPDPALLAALGHTVTSSSYGETAMPQHLTEIRPPQEEFLTPGTLIGGCMIYNALTTDYGSASD